MSYKFKSNEVGQSYGYSKVRPSFQGRSVGEGTPSLFALNFFESIMQTLRSWGAASRVCKWPNGHHVIFERFLCKFLLRVELTCLSFLEHIGG